MERLKEAQTPADFEARLAEGLAAGTLKGCRLREGKLAFETAPDDRDPGPACRHTWRFWKRCFGRRRPPSACFSRRTRIPKNEKYRANSLLTRLGFSGPEHKELRRMLMGHLSGYAAFKNEAGMQAHREKYARLRRGTAGGEGRDGAMSAWMDWIRDVALNRIDTVERDLRGAPGAQPPV